MRIECVVMEGEVSCRVAIRCIDLLDEACPMVLPWQRFAPSACRLMNFANYR